MYIILRVWNSHVRFKTVYIFVHIGCGTIKS